MNCIMLIKQHYPSMTPVEKRIADALLTDLEKSVNSTIVYIAAKAEVSEGSVSNFATSLGYKGFSQLKINLAQSISEYTETDEIIDKDTPQRILGKLIDRANASFKSTLNSAGAELDRAVEYIYAARRVIVFGVGHSKVVAEDIAMRLMRIGINATAEVDPLLAGIAIGQLCENDVGIAVSNTGRTKDVISVAKMAKSVGAKVIGFSSFSNSPLAEFCDALLLSVSVESAVYREATTSRLTQLMLCDCLVESLTHRMGEQAIVNLDMMVDVYEQYREAVQKDKRLN